MGADAIDAIKYFLSSSLLRLATSLPDQHMNVPYLPQSCETILENSLVVSAVFHFPLLLLRTYIIGVGSKERDATNSERVYNV